jgi:hypothetical protein
MATRTPAVTYAVNGDRLISQAVWSGLTQASADVGAGVELPGADRAVQLSGTLGTGGQAPIEGSQDGTNWGALHDAAGNAIVLAAIGDVAQIIESVRYVRPGTTAGNGTTNLTVTLTSRRAA